MVYHKYMSVNDFIKIQKMPAEKDYKIAEQGNGFVIPGADFLASISPDEPIRYIALLRYTQGEKRANHYHEKKVEHLIALDGEIKVELYPIEDKDDVLQVRIKGGDMLTIQPGCNHTLTALTETATILELSPQKLDLSDQRSPGLA